ncbi:MAG: hypothetical protein ACHBN1_07585 [Heteroscytonema crispum UTEX LB 1556]
MTLTADELLAGSTLTHEVEIPADLLSSNGNGTANSRVVLREQCDFVRRPKKECDR